jgi:hypothetical protein
MQHLLTLVRLRLAAHGVPLLLLRGGTPSAIRAPLLPEWGPGAEK